MLNLYLLRLAHPTSRVFVADDYIDPASSKTAEVLGAYEVSAEEILEMPEVAPQLSLNWICGQAAPSTGHVELLGKPGTLLSVEDAELERLLMEVSDSFVSSVALG